jgi:hypothetical protein
MAKIDPVLDYTIPNRFVVVTWVLSAALMTLIGFWWYHLTAMILFIGILLIWVNFNSTALHYALDAEEFTKARYVGEAFVTFQSHHFPRWINTIHRKPVFDLFGELNPLAVINLVVPLVLFQFRYREAYVAWGALMLAGCYAMLCHRWAHQPRPDKPRIATLLQRAHLALSPTEHWKHHALAASPQGRFVPNFDLSFGWSNPVFNRLLKIMPSSRFWLGFIILSNLAQVPALTMLLHWLRR